MAIHRIRLNAKARINHVTAEGLIEQIINETERLPPSGERMYDDTMDDLSRTADICGL